MGRYPIGVVKFPYIFVYNREGLMTIYSACLFITKNNILESLQFEALVKIIAVTYTYELSTCITVVAIIVTKNKRILY